MLTTNITFSFKANRLREDGTSEKLISILVFHCLRPFRCKAAHTCCYLTRWSGLPLFVNLQTGNYTANTAGTDSRARLCAVKTKLSVMVQTRQSIKISSVITFAHRYLTVRYLTLFAVQLCLHKYSDRCSQMHKNTCARSVQLICPRIGQSKESS